MIVILLNIVFLLLLYRVIFNLLNTQYSILNYSRLGLFNNTYILFKFISSIAKKQSGIFFC